IGGGGGGGLTAPRASTRPYVQYEPVPGIASAVLVMRETTPLFVVALDVQTRAARPETCGAAIEVPLKDAYEPVYSEERMSTPGAATSTAGPQFENEARLSALSVAATERVFAQ